MGFVSKIWQFDWQTWWSTVLVKVPCFHFFKSITVPAWINHQAWPSWSVCAGVCQNLASLVWFGPVTLVKMRMDGFRGSPLFKPAISLHAFLSKMHAGNRSTQDVQWTYCWLVQFCNVHVNMIRAMLLMLFYVVIVILAIRYDGYIYIYNTHMQQWYIYNMSTYMSTYMCNYRDMYPPVI